MKIFAIRVRLVGGDKVKSIVTAKNKDDAMSNFTKSLDLYYHDIAIAKVCCCTELTDDNEFVFIGDGRTTHYNSIYALKEVK